MEHNQERQNSAQRAQTALFTLAKGNRANMNTSHMRNFSSIANSSKTKLHMSAGLLDKPRTKTGKLKPQEPSDIDLELKQTINKLQKEGYAWGIPSKEATVSIIGEK